MSPLNKRAGIAKTRVKAEDEKMFSDFNLQVDEVKIRVAKPGTEAKVPPASEKSK